MFYLVIVWCAEASGCVKSVLPTEFPSQMTCVQQSQIAAAEWYVLNPGRRIERLRCVEARRLPRELGRDAA